MDAGLSSLRLEERLTEALGLEKSQYSLIVQVGSSVVYGSALSADVDVVGLAEGWMRASMAQMSAKRVFRAFGEPDIEFTEMPLSLPDLLASEEVLHFYLFRERRKLERSRLLFGRPTTHQHLVECLTTLPLPSTPVRRILRRVREQIRAGATHAPDQVSAFLGLMVLLGYTHFRNGPVKPKWMLAEVRAAKDPSLIGYARTILGPMLQLDASPFARAALRSDEEFTSYWREHGTAWRDAEYLVGRDDEAAALTLLYCLHAYANHAALRPAVYADFLERLQPKLATLSDTATVIADAVERAAA